MGLPFRMSKATPHRDSVMAVIDAKESLNEVHQESSEIKYLVSDLRRLRQSNHFADSFRRAFEAG